MNGSQELRSQDIAQNAKARIGTRREKKLTQKIVKELFDYNHGALIWKVKIAKNTMIGEVAGSRLKNGYIKIGIMGKNFYAHRIVWLWHHGYMPEHGLDHKDRIRWHNEVENLREASKSCNMKNSGNSSRNISGVKGVHWSHRGNKWLVNIRIGSKTKYLGIFSDFTEAVALRLAAEQCLEWDSCDSCSPAYLYMHSLIINRLREIEARAKRMRNAVDRTIVTKQMKLPRMTDK